MEARLISNQSVETFNIALNQAITHGFDIKLETFRTVTIAASQHPFTAIYYSVLATKGITEQLSTFRP